MGEYCKFCNRIQFKWNSNLNRIRSQRFCFFEKDAIDCERGRFFLLDRIVLGAAFLSRRGERGMVMMNEFSYTHLVFVSLYLYCISPIVFLDYGHCSRL